jgi:hypothetical protein
MLLDHASVPEQILTNPHGNNVVIPEHMALGEEGVVQKARLQIRMEILVAKVYCIVELLRHLGN